MIFFPREPINRVGMLIGRSMTLAMLVTQLFLITAYAARANENLVDDQTTRTVIGLQVGDHKPAAGAVFWGAQIIAIVPGGPADRAGLRANDVIVGFCG